MSWTRTATVSETQTESLCSTPFPLPTGAVPKRWNIGGRHGRNYATPSLRRKGLMFVSTTEAMSVRAWSFFPPSMRAQPSGQWRRKAYVPTRKTVFSEHRFDGIELYLIFIDLFPYLGRQVLIDRVVSDDLSDIAP